MSLFYLKIPFHLMPDFLALSTSEQQILLYLLQNRDISTPPYYSHYTTIENIMDTQSLKRNTVEQRIRALTRKGWISKADRKFTLDADGKPRPVYRWTFPLIDVALDECHAIEENDGEVILDVEQVPDGAMEHDNCFWRPSNNGLYDGYEVKRKGSQMWIFRSEEVTPEPVKSFFS